MVGVNHIKREGKSPLQVADEIAGGGNLLINDQVGSVGLLPANTPLGSSDERFCLGRSIHEIILRDLVRVSINIFPNYFNLKLTC